MLDLTRPKLKGDGEITLGRDPEVVSAARTLMALRASGSGLVASGSGLVASGSGLVASGSGLVASGSGLPSGSGVASGSGVKVSSSDYVKRLPSVPSDSQCGFRRPSPSPS